MIRCEDGSRVIFPSRRSYDEYARMFCCGHWQNCTLARSLLDQYEIGDRR